MSVQHRTAPPYLDGARIRVLLPPAEALRAVQDFFASHSRDAVVAPDRIHLPVPGQDTVGLYMPAATHEHVGVKIAHLMPSRRPAVEAEVFLYDAGTGRLRFWGEGRVLSGLRTAAVSCAASLRLKPAIRRLVVFGAGVQGEAHVMAFGEAYPMLEEIALVCRSQALGEALIDRLPAPLAARCRLSGDPAAHLARADAVVTTTPSREPLFAWDDVPSDVHLVGIGSATPAMNELPPRAFLNAQVWLDTPNALREAGDCHAAVTAGWRPGDVAGDLFDLLGAAPGTLPQPGRATLFKSAGHSAQDLALLIRLWQRLEEERTGTG